MSTPQLRTKLSEMFKDTGEAHHKAFASTNGVDPDWPIFYADYLKESLGATLHTEFTRSQLIYCLMNADFEQQARDPDADWTQYDADYFIEKFSPTDSPSDDKLVLYHFLGCPFCAMVTRAIDDLGVDVELRDINEDPKYRDELISARDRATVPVLRITSADGENHWMPESRDIVHYLEQTFA